MVRQHWWLYLMFEWDTVNILHYYVTKLQFISINIARESGIKTGMIALKISCRFFTLNLRFCINFSFLFQVSEVLLYFVSPDLVSLHFIETIIGLLKCSIFHRLKRVKSTKNANISCFLRIVEEIRFVYNNYLSPAVASRLSQQKFSHL